MRRGKEREGGGERGGDKERGGEGEVGIKRERCGKEVERGGRRKKRYREREREG